MSDCTGCQNLSNPTHPGTREMCQNVQDVKYSGFILVNRTILGPCIFVGCHRMSEKSGVELYMFHCIFFYIINIVLVLNINICRMPQDVGIISCRIAQIPL